VYCNNQYLMADNNKNLFDDEEDEYKPAEST
jgi:hypothetical protein